MTTPPYPARSRPSLVTQPHRPAIYAIVDVCPPLETKQDLNNFIGKNILVGHDSKQARGWFRGLVHSTGLSTADKRKTPTANFIIKYERGHTDKKLHGMEARELSAALYGVAAWWVELKVV